MEKKFGKLIIIAGPTAVGKSAAAVRLAKRIGGEIISADSMQVYRGMDIGTAKVTPAEMDGVPHHLIDILDVNTDFNAALFQRYAYEACEDIYARGHIPIVCGGTGFYIQAMLYGIDFTEEPERDDAYRESLWKLAGEQGGEAVYSVLREIDPLTAATIDRYNTKRVIRALEYFRLHQESIVLHNRAEEARKQSSPFDYRFFVLFDERDALYARIDARVDRMVRQGLLQEALRLKADGLRMDSTASQGIGYREIYEHLDQIERKGRISSASNDEQSENCYTNVAQGAEDGYNDREKPFGLTALPEAVVARIKVDSRHYAKRQLTWFKREKNAVWIDVGKGDPLDEIWRQLEETAFVPHLTGPT